MTDLVLRPPNDEQKLAIEHRGGVLLSAGAGSGKTFVLVEHIIYLFGEFCKENAHVDSMSFSRELKNYFSEIVLMTFTKKAAGELFLRMKKRFQLGLDRAREGMESESLWMWEEAQIALPYLYIGTIHGFCYRLINQGYITGFTGDEEMITDVEYSSKIESLVEQWLDLNFDMLKENGLEHLILNKKYLKKNFIEIFSDTDIRILWASINSQKRKIEDENYWIEEIINLILGHEWKRLYINASLHMPDSKKIPKWYEFLEGYTSVISESKDILDFIAKSQAFFEGVSRFPSVKAGKVDDEVYQFFKSSKKLRDYLKTSASDFFALRDSFEGYRSWTQKIFELYSFVEKEYFQIPGLTFTDLEFYVWKALNGDQTVIDQVSSSYKYFIIDEFQDTSNVQFSIVRKIITEDMARVFSVGDVKQAIYGFRGGELGVFNEASEKTYQNLSLRNNYRSAKNVIEFNNGLFEGLLPLGKDYVGEDPFTVTMTCQKFPEVKEHEGNLEKVCLNVTCSDEAKKGLLATELNHIESQAIADYLVASEEEIAVLYRKLAPTKFLIPMLMEKECGFTCQVKVALDEDPLLCLFLEFARVCAYRTVESKKVLYYLLKKLGMSEELGDFESDFEQESKVGLLEAFKGFLWKTGFSSSGLDQSYSLIQVLKDLSGDRAKVVFEYAKSFLNGNYSLDFQYGENPSRIKVMTVHASKGLEFETVILGGIHTNGSSKSGGQSFGKIPYSLKWSAGVGKTEFYKSPAFLYEQEVNKLKEFAEFKRLFYVATTRAVDKLFWIDISFNESRASFSKSSWINALRLFEDSAVVNSAFANLKERITDREVSYEECFEEDANLSLDIPMYHRDGLGVYFTENKNQTLLGIGAELSVTRLATLVSCPRKFFLENVLKFNEDDISFLGGEAEKSAEKDWTEEEGASVFDAVTSSSSRGSEVHEVLESSIKHNLILPLKHGLDERALRGVEWVLESLKEKSMNCDFVSEKQMKFSFFGQMISGIPDLVINDKEGEVLEVWDFKTGSANPTKLEPYWFQLKAYAYALLKESGNTNKKVKLVLAFVDEKNFYENELDYSEIESELFVVWKKLGMFDEFNRGHCAQCDFADLCIE